MKVEDELHKRGDAPSAAGVPPHSGSLRADRGSVNAGRQVSAASAPLVDSKQPDQASPATIVVYTVAFVVLTVLSNVYRKKMYNAYGTKYTFFRQELTNFMYNVWATITLLGRMLLIKNFKLGSKRVTCCRRGGDAFPVIIFAGLGFLDGLADFLQAVAGTDTPGPWTVLLGQSKIFLILILSYVVLSTRYGVIQAVGGALAVVGSCLAILPHISSCSSAHHCAWYSVVIFAAADIPTSFSFVFKEWAFKKAHLDVFFLTACVSWMQLAIVWLFLPLQQLHGFGGIAFDDIPEALSQGAKCFVGDTSVPVMNGDVIDGYCGWYQPYVTFVFSLSGFFAGIFQLLVVKHGSAALMVVGFAITVPLSDVAFAIPAFMGADAKRLNGYNIGGVALVSIGFLAYNLTPAVTRQLRQFAHRVLPVCCPPIDTGRSSSDEAEDPLLAKRLGSGDVEAGDAKTRSEAARHPSVTTPVLASAPLLDRD